MHGRMYSKIRGLTIRFYFYFIFFVGYVYVFAFVPDFVRRVKKIRGFRKIFIYSPGLG